MLIELQSNYGDELFSFACRISVFSNLTLHSENEAQQLHLILISLMICILVGNVLPSV